MMAEKRILLLAGTGDARRLAPKIAALPGISVVASLAGAVERPAALGVETRVGGFGGVAGLVDYIERWKIAAIVDATHPFAVQMSAHAVEASRNAGIPLLRFERPAWQAQAEDRWIGVADVAEAVMALPAGARAFLAVGRKEISAFAARNDIWCLMRMIDPPGEAKLPKGELLFARPSISAGEEQALFRRHRISHLVAKNSGGPASYAKIEAARNLALPVVMIARPALTPGPTAVDPDAVISWLANLP